MIDYWVLDEKLIINPSNEQLNRATERIQIIQNNFDDVVIETWNLDDDRIIDFAFCISEIEMITPCEANYWNPKYYMRKKHFEKHGIIYTPQSMRRLSLPKKLFKGTEIERLRHWLY